MLALCCTKKVRDQFRIGVNALHEPATADAALGHWYVNAIPIGRRKALLFMSERTLLSFLLHGLRKDNAKDLPQLFLRGLLQLLQFESFKDEEIKRCLPADGTIALSATSSKKALGNMNDLAFHYEHAIFHDGGLASCDLWAIVQEINRMPQRNIGWKYSIDVAREMAAHPVI